MPTPEMMDQEATYRSPREGFAEMADTYDARLAGNPMLLVESTETLAALPALHGASVADFGCGTGRYTLQLARLGAEQVTGIDFVPEMLSVARRKANRADLPITWESGDLAEGIALPDASFDAAICAQVLSFISDPARAFAEMVRLLRPGARLIISDYHPHGLAAARAASAAIGRKDNAPYLRFTTAGGEEWRIAQYPHRVSDLFAAATGAGLHLDHVAEPVVDRRLANTYANLRGSIGLPLALVLRFTKG